MAPQHHYGRIHKPAFAASTAIFLALAIAGVVIRCVIRFRVPNQGFQIDDGLFILAFALLLTSQVMIYEKVMEPMYLLAALQGRIPGIEIPPNLLEIGHSFHIWEVATMSIGWCCICTVKFYFLAFFKRLIDRLPFWHVYWWIVVIFNLGQLGFGVTVYYLGCPFWDERELHCSSGKYMSVLVRTSAAQISLDIAADLLILVIPIAIIWKIKVQWTQKLVLTCSLCLTFVLVALSIIRIAGLVYHGAVDMIWEVHWQSMSAELGVFLAAASTFRSFFVAQRQNRNPPSSFNRWLRSSTPKNSARNETDSLFGSWSGCTDTGEFERLSHSHGDSNPSMENAEWYTMSGHCSTDQTYNATLDPEAGNDLIQGKAYPAEPASVLQKAH